MSSYASFISTEFRTYTGTAFAFIPGEEIANVYDIVAMAGRLHERSLLCNL